MQNDESEYQEFLFKTMKASKEFVDDYNKLSPQNKLRFQHELEMKFGLDIARNLFIFLQNKM